MDKIYKVIEHDVFLDAGVNNINVKVFSEEKNAMEYLKNQIKEIKKQFGEDSDYVVDEADTFYNRYLDGRASEEEYNIWIEEDELADQKELLEENELEKED